MSPDIGIIITALLLVIVFPLCLSAQEYFRDKNLAQPVVQFSLSWWHNMSLFWTLVQTSFGLALLAGAVSIIVRDGPQLGLFIVDIFMLLVAWRCFPAICLYWTYWTYWHWDGRARLSFNRAERTMTYVNREISFTFAVSEIELLSCHEPTITRAASSDYSYTILHLSDARELVVTSLLWDIIEWSAILPAVKTEFVKQRFAWLPTDLKSRKFFSPFAK
ncbi:hypothetical protein MON38_12205 [Hymenobacter sp. DH14]|uniref:PH domain-containing protein n=1 Tax=Hymenobacter cyanobacteriorum TaxID=2926463 RepID=A0A9X2AGY9_9BACT|nr:hypothetical protein [Hymenobacter cyanobacteriorum]MCI1188183.1 hypothetical protein [Hymenobacter cyanobacteriorum]